MRSRRAACGALRELLPPVLHLAAGGSSRSTVVEAAAAELQGRSGSRRYKVKQVPFNEVLRDRHTVVKLDCEGAELPILRETTNWKNCRVLVAELSVKQMRANDMTGKGWEALATIFESLRQAGFLYARLDRRFFEVGYWNPLTKDKKYLSDGIAWFLRPATQFPDDRVPGRFLLWQCFRGVMSQGGVAGSALSLDKTYTAVMERSKRRCQTQQPDAARSKRRR